VAPSPLLLHQRLTRSPWPGAVAVASAGAVWAILCGLLAAGGHAPSVTLLPIPRERYYLAQALFVVPVLLAQWALCAALAHAAARALGGRGALPATANALGLALAVPLLVIFLVPDLVAYLSMGFAALGPLVRVTAPLALIGSLVLATAAVRSTHALGTGRALAAAAAGVLAQAAAGGVFLR
jgi:hypothetical protein